MDYSWSPNSDWIAYSHGEDIRNIWLIRPDGTGKRKLTQNGGCHPSFSPDGSWIVYEHKGDIWKVNIDGGDHHTVNLTGDIVDRCSRPELSPVDDRIAFLVRGNIWTTNSEGVRPKRLTTKEGVVDFKWSPDGKRIVYGVEGGGILDYR
jgi:Tol biopolymer transport system component